MAIKTVTVKQDFVPKKDNEKAYKVVQLTDNASYDIGEMLSKDDVRRISMQAGWKITVK